MRSSTVKSSGYIAITLVLLAGNPLVSIAQEEEFEPLRTVHVMDEPRHRTMHQDGNIRVLDVQINPGDTTLPHTHDFAIMYTFISNGSGSTNGRVSSITDYVNEPLTHRVSNEGPGLFRILALTNTGPAMPESSNDSPQGIAVAPQLENPWFRSYRIELAPGESTSMHTHQNPIVLVLVNEGLVHVSRADGITAELDTMGDWTWRDAAAGYQVRNTGTTPVSIVINEARRM